MKTKKAKAKAVVALLAAIAPLFCSTCYTLLKHRCTIAFSALAGLAINLA